MSKKGRRNKASKKRASGAPPKSSAETRAAAPASAAPPQVEAEVAVRAGAREEPRSVESVGAEPAAIEAAAPPAVSPEPVAVRPQEAPSPQGESAGDRADDEGSFPPVEFEQHFFESFERRVRTEPVELDAPEPDLRAARKMSAAAAARRARFARYVGMAVALAGAVCLAAAGKAAVLRYQGGSEDLGAGESSAARHSAAQAAQLAPSPASAAVPEAPRTEPAPPSEPSAPTAVTGGNGSPPVNTADAAAAAPENTAAPSATAAPDPHEAAKAKAQAQKALNHGRTAEAIEAGERSVGLDPTDSQAWLLLGAAYQEKGDAKNARRCYKSCLSEGKRGDKSDCAAMLR